MALILRPEDGKIISVSRKKILCHEEIYATFDSSKGMTPATGVENFKLNLDNVKEEMEGLTWTKRSIKFRIMFSRLNFWTTTKETRNSTR
jgi:hypothetical protein